MFNAKLKSGLWTTLIRLWLYHKPIASQSTLHYLFGKIEAHMDKMPRAEERGTALEVKRSAMTSGLENVILRNPLDGKDVWNMQ